MALDITLELLDCNGLTELDFTFIEQDDFFDRIFHHKQYFKGNEFAFSLYNGKWITIDGESFPAYDKGRWWSKKFGERWIVFENPVSKKDFYNAVTENATSNSYSQFESIGARFINGGKKICLAGGSFCDTNLKQINNKIVVEKSISLNENISEMQQDTILKFRREVEFIKEYDLKFFPRILSFGEIGGRFHAISEFFHGYTLAEKIFHKSITNIESIDLLTEILTTLKSTIYNKGRSPGRWTSQEDRIIDRIIRRFDALILSSDEITLQWKSLLLKDYVTINEKKYMGWPKLLKWIKAKQATHFLEFSNEICHGDLIFDAILVSAHREWKLIDPNGDAISKYYDLGKLSLSLLSSYELLKYDCFHLEYSDVDYSGIPKFHFSIKHSSSKAMFSIALQLPYIIFNSGFCEQEELSGNNLLLLNGLHNASLPWFHLIHHRNQNRSIAFFLFAIIRLNQFIHASESGKRISLTEAVTVCLTEGGIYH